MPPVVLALMAFLGLLFQSRQGMHLKILALQHKASHTSVGGNGFVNTFREAQVKVSQHQKIT
jgi:hypothetical protein